MKEDRDLFKSIRKLSESHQQDPKPSKQSRMNRFMIYRQHDSRPLMDLKKFILALKRVALVFRSCAAFALHPFHGAMLERRVPEIVGASLRLIRFSANSVLSKTLEHREQFFFPFSQICL